MKKSQKNPEFIRLKKALLLLLIAALFAAGIVSPAVSAADIVHGIDVHDYVLIGEEGLDFSEFVQDGSNFIAPVSGTEPQMSSSISLNSPTSVKIEGVSITGERYCAVTSSGSTTFANYSVYCWVEKTDKFPFSLTTSDKALVNKLMTITLKGKPGATYMVSVPGESDKTYTIPRDSSKEQEVTFSFTPDEAGQHTITAKCTWSGITDDIGKETNLHISVSATKQNVKMSVKIPADAASGIMASGDIIKLSGTIENIEYADPAINNVYLYITGRNLDANGVSLDDKEAVIDGEVSTFTRVDEFDAKTGTWEYLWNTTGRFEPGTYTIYAVTQMKGQLSALDIGITPASTELYLSDKSIHVKFAEENGGLFTQGDVMYSYWSARGSPDKVRWYIIGPNFLETGLEEKFSLYTADQKKGENAPQGVWGFVYDRYFSETMDPGNYYLVFQHPGYNGEFDVNPDGENGCFSSLNTTFGESASLAGRPSSNCAEALQTLIDDSLCDDLCVITDLTIESPWISVEQVDNLAIGDKLKIKGKTNYAGEGTPVDGSLVENTFSLRIERLNFDITEENAAMQLATVARVVPENIIPYAGERTYEFDEIDTSTWFAGTYQATVTNIDTGFEESIMFTVGGEGTVVDSSTLNVPSNPTEEPYEELEPLPPIERYEEPTEPEEPKSPGFILAPLALGLAVILRRK